MRFLRCLVVIAASFIVCSAAFAEATASLIITPGDKDEIKVQVRIAGVDKLQAYGFQIEFNSQQTRFMGVVPKSISIFGDSSIEMYKVMENNPNLLESISIDLRLFQKHEQMKEGIVNGGGSLGTFVFQNKGTGVPVFRMFKLKILETDDKDFKEVRTNVVINGSSSFTLNQNYPNPFNPETQISFRLQEDSKIRLVVYNILGQEVRTLVDEASPAGIYSVTWNGKDQVGRQVASGTYIYRLVADNKIIATRKMILLK